MIQLYSDLQFGRMTAYGDKVISGVWWGGGTSFTSYQIRSDANNNGVIDDTGVDTQIGATVTVKNDVGSITSSAPAGQQSVSFDGRGFLNTANAPDNNNPITFSVAPSYGASIDCVMVATTQIILGKMNAGTCAQK